MQKGTSRLVVRDGSNNSVTWAGERLLYLKNTLRSPNEIFTVKADGKDEKQITDLNGACLAKAQMGETEQFTFQGWNGETVYAYVVKPYDYTPEAAAAGRKWPVAFLVHGGPQGSFGNDFHYRWNPQAYVGAGFATVAVDFHGSTGYGQAVHRRHQPPLGRPSPRGPREGPRRGAGEVHLDGRQQGGRRRRELRRLHDQLDARPALRQEVPRLRHPRRQPRRAHGLLRHRGAVVPRVGARRHARGTNAEGYASHNPIDYVQNWSVPTLVVHGALDYRVVDTHGMSTFTALRRQGVPARFLHFPDENHWVLKPANSIQWHEEVMGWLKKWTQ